MSNASKINRDGKPQHPPGHSSTATEGTFDPVDRARLVCRLSEMIAIASINPFDASPRAGFREQELAEYYLEQMSSLGMEVGQREIVTGRSNVWGRLKGSSDGPTLMLSGHLDTIGTDNYPDALQPRVANGRVYGRGSCDMKASLAAYLEVVQALRASALELEGDLLITGLADEEHLMIGSRDLGRNGPWADYGIVGEPTDLAICPAHKGQVGFLIKTFGQAVHSSQPENGVNAISAMARVIEAFEAYGKQLKQRGAHPLCGHATSCPSVIRGGTIVSTVPDLCALEFDRRTLPGETTQGVKEEYQQLLDGLAAATPGFRYGIEGTTIEVGPLDTPIDNPIVQSVIGAYQNVFGREGTVRAFLGGTDAPNFGFPTVICGPGNIAQAHSTNEYIEIEDIVSAVKIYLSVVVDLLVK